MRHSGLHGSGISSGADRAAWRWRRQRARAVCAGGGHVGGWRVSAVHAHGEAVQDDPIKPTLKPPGTERLRLKYDELLSCFAFNFNSRRYMMGGMPFDDPLAAQQAAPRGHPLPDSFFTERLERSLKLAAAAVASAGGGGGGGRAWQLLPATCAATTRILKPRSLS